MTTYYPISLVPIQYEDSSGNPYSGAVLKAYSVGTTTPMSMATSYTGAVTVASMTLNSSGYPAVSGNVVIPHFISNYKLALYPTQADADLDTGAIWTVDNNQLFLTPSLNSTFDKFNGTGAQTVFTLAQDLGTQEKSISVFVDAGAGEGFQPMLPTSFTVNGTSLTFTSAPAAGTNNIRVWCYSTSDASAAASATAAAASASAASSSASAASTSASAASASASSASTSASTATTQAGIATTQAGIATTQAGNAASSASTATTQAGIATTQAGNASSSASTATTQAGIATTQAGNASASASAAATSASNASTSETNAAASAAKLTGTSTTSLAIGVGSKVFTTQAGKFFDAGNWLLVTSDADPTNYMHGQVTSYVGTTLTLNVTNIGGSGTLADWTIRVSGTRGAVGSGLGQSAKVITIGPSGCNYTTIQSALTANAAGGELFLVSPGTYASDTINFTASDQCIVGLGTTRQQIITQASATICNFAAYTNCRLKNLTLTISAATTAVSCITGTTGSIEVIDVNKNITNSSCATAAQPSFCSLTGAGTANFYGGIKTYTNTVTDGTGVTAIKAGYLQGTGTITLDHINAVMTGSGQSLGHTTAYTASSGNVEIYNSEINISDTGTTIVAGYYSGGSGTLSELVRNDFIISRTGGTAVGIYQAGTNTVESYYNDYDVTGTTANNFIVGAGCTLKSNYDQEGGASGNSVTGTLTYNVGKVAQGGTGNTTGQAILMTAAGGGTVDAITATYSPAITLADLTTVAFVSSGANTSTTPTFSPDGLTAHTIVKEGGQALVAGDIGAAGAVHMLEYNSANTRWELLNPKQNSGTSANQLVRLNGSAQLPAVSGALLTNLPTGAQQLVLLATATASSSSSLNFTSVMTSAYSQYHFVIEGLLTSVDATIGVKLSTNNGSTWVATVDYKKYYIVTGNTTADTLTGGSTPGMITHSVGASSTWSGRGTFTDPVSKPTWESLCSNCNGSMDRTVFLSYDTAINAIQFLPSAGNFTSGKIYMYGVKNI